MANQEERFQKSLASKDQDLLALGSQVKQFTAEHISFKILIARSGSDEGDWRDVTNLLNEDLNANQLLDFVVSNVYFASGSGILYPVHVVSERFERKALLNDEAHIPIIKDVNIILAICLSRLMV